MKDFVMRFMRLVPSFFMNFVPSNAGPVIIIGIFSLCALAIGGWIANIVKLFGLASVPDPNYVMAILRAVGIFVAPLGVILGFL